MADHDQQVVEPDLALEHVDVGGRALDQVHDERGGPVQLLGLDQIQGEPGGAFPPCLRIRHGRRVPRRSDAPGNAVVIPG